MLWRQVRNKLTQRVTKCMASHKRVFVYCGKESGHTYPIVNPIQPSNSDFCPYLTSRYQMRYIAAFGSISIGKLLEAKSRTCFDTSSSCMPDLLTLKSAKNL